MNNIIRLLFSSVVIALCAQIAPSVHAQMSQAWPSAAHQNAESECARAVSLLELGQIDNALAALSKGTADDANDPRPPQLLGAALMVQGRYNEALDSLKRSYSLRPDSETVLTTGLVYYLQHDYPAALNAYHKILEGNPKLCQIYGNIGMAYFRGGEFEKAKEAFSHLVTGNPNSQLGYYGLALADSEMGNFERALEEVQRAESIHSYPPALLLQAELDYLCGNKSRANKEANRSISYMHKHWRQRSMTELGYPHQHDFHFDPYLADFFDNGYFLLARTQKSPFWKKEQAGLGRIRSAMAKAQDAIAAAKTDWMLNEQLGLLQLAAGDYSSAAESFKAQLQECGNCRRAMLHLAEAYQADGKAELASGLVHDFQQMQPRQEIAQQFIDMTHVDPALKFESKEAHYQHTEKLEEVPVPQPRLDPGKDF